MLTLPNFIIKTCSLGAICATVVYAHYLIQELIKFAYFLAHEIKNLLYWRRISLKGNTDAIYYAAWTTDGKYLITGSSDSTYTWNTKTNGPAYILQGSNSLALSNDGAYIAVAAQDSLTLYTVSGGHMRYTFKTTCGRVNKIAFSPNNEYIAAGTNRGDTLIWHVISGKTTCRLQGHTDGITALAWHHDGLSLITSSWDGTSRIWNTSTGETIHLLHDKYDTFFITRVLPRSTAYVLQLQISPSGHVIATGSVLGTVAIWNIETGTIIERHTEHTGSIQALSFSPDGNLLASASTDDTVRIWNITTGTCLATHTGHIEGARALAFSPNGAQLASADGNGTIFLWDTSHENCWHTIQGHADQISSLTFSNDGTELLSASHDGKARVWKL